MSKKSIFYNNYHLKNKKFFKIISSKSITYYEFIKEINKILLSFVSRSKMNIKVLDVGCGVGSLSFYLASKGFNVYGIDISTRAIDICNAYKNISRMRNINFSNLDLDHLTLKKVYDFVICTEVIEHITNDSIFLKKISKHIKKGGYLLLSTPSINAPLYKLGLLKKFDTDVGHLRRYSTDSLSRLITKNNLVIVSLAKKESFIRNLLFTYRPFGFLLKFIKGPLVPIFQSIDQFLVNIFGESDLLVVARKK